MKSPLRRTGSARVIGVLHGCTLDVVSDTLWNVKADLAVAGIHLRDPAPMILAGLERALGGDLHGLRGAGVLTGRLGETLLLSKPPTPIKAGAVLVLGLGTVDAVTARTVRRAAETAADQATRMQVGYVASACGSQDGTGTSAISMPHLWAAIAGIEDVLRNSRTHVRRWSFLCPDAELASVADSFRGAFVRATGDATHTG